MRFRCIAAAVMVCGLASIAGCPAGLDLSGFDLDTLLRDLGSDGEGRYSAYATIKDGAYSGRCDAEATWWYGGDYYDDATGRSEATASFVDGAVLDNYGSALQVGDVEDNNWGLFVVTREVYDVVSQNGITEIYYDVWTYWDSIPMVGTEYVSYTANADGTIEMFDELELSSAYDYDGGAWAFHADAYGTLAPWSGGGGSSGGSGGYVDPIEDILDKKSGKIRR